MENMKIYEAVRNPPNEALKSIKGGRLTGMTDISPMWRIKTLTEQFGPCGFGWKYVITRKWMETLSSTGEMAAFVDIDLYIKVDGEWSEAIPGTGGNTFVAKEKNGLRMDDDCFKKALTDAISVAAKALGVGADVYWKEDITKYSAQDEAQEPSQKPTPAPAPTPHPALVCAECGKLITDGRRNGGEVWPASDIAIYTERKFGRPLCLECGTKASKAGDA